MPRNCSRTATLATWTILSALWSGLATGQLAERAGSKAAYGGPGFSIYDAGKNDAPHEGYALKKLVRESDEARFAGNGERTDGEGGSKGIIRSSKLATAGFIGTALPIGSKGDAPSSEEAFRISRGSGTNAGGANNSVDGAIDGSKESGEGREDERSLSGNYRAIDGTTSTPETSWIFRKAIKRSQDGSNEAVGRSGATRANRWSAETRKIETSSPRDVHRRRGNRESLAIETSRWFETTEYERRRSRFEDAIRDANEDNVRRNAGTETLIPAISRRLPSGKSQSRCGLTDELESGTADDHPRRISAEKIKFELVTASSRNIDSLAASRDPVYRSILRQKSTVWRHSIPRPNFNYESSTPTSRSAKFSSGEGESTDVRIYSKYAPSSKLDENAFSGEQVDSSLKEPTERYFHLSLAGNRIKRDAEAVTRSSAKKSETPSAEKIPKDNRNVDAKNYQISRTPERGKKRNFWSNVDGGNRSEDLRPNEIQGANPRAFLTLATGNETPSLSMRNMNRSQVPETTNARLGRSDESQIVWKVAAASGTRGSVAQDYLEKDEDEESVERLLKVLNGFQADISATPNTRNEALLSTPEYHPQNPEMETIPNVRYTYAREHIVPSNPAPEEKLSVRKSTQSKLQFHGDRVDQSENESAYTESGFSHETRHTSTENQNSRSVDVTNRSECADGSVPCASLNAEQDITSSTLHQEAIIRKVFLVNSWTRNKINDFKSQSSKKDSDFEIVEHSPSTVTVQSYNKKHLANLAGRFRGIAYPTRGSMLQKSAEVQRSIEMAEKSNETRLSRGSIETVDEDTNREANVSVSDENSTDTDVPTTSSLDFKQIEWRNTFITVRDRFLPTEAPPTLNLEQEKQLTTVTTSKNTLINTTVENAPIDAGPNSEIATEESELNFFEAGRIVGVSQWKNHSSNAGESNFEETKSYSLPDGEQTSTSRGGGTGEETSESSRVSGNVERNSTHSRYDTSGPIASTPKSIPEGVGLKGMPGTVVRNVLASSENPGIRSMQEKKVESLARNLATVDGSDSDPIHVAFPKSSAMNNSDRLEIDVKKLGNDVSITSPRSLAVHALTDSLETDAEKLRNYEMSAVFASDSTIDGNVTASDHSSAAAMSDTASISLTNESTRDGAKELNGYPSGASIIGLNDAEATWELSSRNVTALNTARTRSLAEERTSEKPLDGTTRPAVDRTKDLEDSRDWRSRLSDDPLTASLTASLADAHPFSREEGLPRPSKRSSAKLSASGATTPGNAEDETTSTVNTEIVGTVVPTVSSSATASSTNEAIDARTTEEPSSVEIDFATHVYYSPETSSTVTLATLDATNETLTANDEGPYVSTLNPITRISLSAEQASQFDRTLGSSETDNASGTKDFAMTTAVSLKGSDNASQDDASLNQWPVKHSAVVEGDLVLGGLMMVHEREDTVTCGPVMPQGGVQALEAMLYTLDTLNDMEIVPGVKIGAHILDDCDKDTYGLEMAVDFIKGSISNIDGAEYHCNKTAVRKVISGVVGAASSVTSIQVANLLRLFRIPQVSFFSTSPELSNKQRFEYFTRTIPSDHYQVKAMVDIVLTMGWSYVSIIYEESNYGIKAFEELEELLAKNEICIAVKEKLVKDSGVAEETAYDNIVLKLLTKPRARGCIIFGSDQEVAGVMRAVRRCNATGAFSWIGSDGWSARGLVSNGNEPEVEGTLSVQPQANPVKGFEEYFLNLTVENNRRNPWFVEFWEDHFQCRYPNASRTPFNQKYTKMCTTKERLTKQNTAFEDQLQFVSDAVMAFAYAFRDMHMDLCGGKAGLCDAMKPTKGTELLKYLRKVDFEGLSGDNFKFDKNGDGPARYNIIHFKQTQPGKYKWIRVGKYLQGELRLNMTEIQFKLGHPQPPESVCSLPCEVGQPKKYVEGERCCWHCFNCTQYQIRHPEDETQCIPCRKGTLPDETHSACRDIPEEFLRTESGWAIGAMSFSATGILVTLFVAGVFVRHNETPIVRASGRELSYVLLTGILLCYLVTFALVLKPSDIVCGIQRFAVGFCFTVVYAALLTKTNRIARIFNASKHSAKRPSFISPRSQLIICSGLVGVQILINGVWMVIDPARAIHHYPTREDNLLVCNSYIDASYMIAFAYPIMLIVVCTVYAVITRKIPEAFNESKHIGFTMYTTCVIWLAFVPLYFGTGNHVALRITSMSVTISLSASVTIACLFSPKLYIILIRPERNVRQSMMIGKYGTTKSSTATTNASSMMAPVALTAATCDQNKAVKKHIIATIDCSTQSEYYELEVKDQKNGKPPANVVSRSTQTQVSNNEKDSNAVATANKEKESATTAKPINNNARIGNGPVAQGDVPL